MARRISFNEKKAFEYYKDGLPDQNIADNCGVCRDTVRNWRKRRGLAANVSKETPQKREKERRAKISPLAADNAAARAAGMNYGQYKAKLYAEAAMRKGGKK